MRWCYLPEALPWLRIALSNGITRSRFPVPLTLCWQEELEIETRFFEVPLSQQIKRLHDDLYDVGFAQTVEVACRYEPVVISAKAREVARQNCTRQSWPVTVSLGATYARQEDRPIPNRPRRAEETPVRIVRLRADQRGNARCR